MKWLNCMNLTPEQIIEIYRTVFPGFAKILYTVQ